MSNLIKIVKIKMITPKLAIELRNKLKTGITNHLLTQPKIPQPSGNELLHTQIAIAQIID